MTRQTRRLFFAPEVVQTSAMDCGPASLKSILEGFGVPVSYGRLREACQTDVDGTSIDVLEDVANQLGLEAEQAIVPLDHLLLREAGALPAVLVVLRPDGNTHFVVAWRRVGNFVQVMDPGVGRRWMKVAELLSRTFVHAMPVPAGRWRDWAGSDIFQQILRARLREIGATGCASLITVAHQDSTWRSIAALDASIRMVGALVRAEAVARGADAERLLRASFETACSELAAGAVETSIPSPYWSAAHAAAEDGEEQILLRGAVAVKVRRPGGTAAEDRPSVAPLSPELAAALKEPGARPLREIVRLLREDGLLDPVVVTGAALVAAIGSVVEALILGGSLVLGQKLATWHQRVGALAVLTVFFGCLLGLELPIVGSVLTMGRKLEMRLRTAFFEKIPRLGDRYFRSRPVSDMTHRAHAIHVIRQVPTLAYRLLRSGAELLATTAGLAWLDPPSAPLMALAAVVSVAIPLATQSSLTERDLRVRDYQGALGRFHLDALLGLMAIRTHGADRILRREHESMMGHFQRAFLELVARTTAVDALDAILGVVVAVGLLAHYLGTSRDPAGALLLVYWALNVPAIGTDLAQSLRQYPANRNTTLRLLEPLGALEDVAPEAEGPEPAIPLAPSAARGVELRFEGVAVRAGGQTLLEEIDLHVAAGDHLAIVGPSGAGKSTLVGLLLGWHRAGEGRVLIDGAALTGERLDRLRVETAWVDPAIQLWNRSLLANLQYGAPASSAALSDVLSLAEVDRVVERMPDGLATMLGDGGALVSGGEGQRVRLARAMLRKESRLVILDEPFRGLDRDARRRLLARARTLWADATLLCVTHDVGDTLDFPRVLVVDEGHIREDAPPQELAAREDSRYRALLDAEQLVQHGLWTDTGWRRLELRDGTIAESSRPDTNEGG